MSSASISIGFVLEEEEEEEEEEEDDDDEAELDPALPVGGACEASER